MDPKNPEASPQAPSQPVPSQSVHEVTPVQPVQPATALETQPSATATLDDSEGPPEAQPKSKKILLVIVAIIIVLVFVVVAGTAYYFSTKPAPAQELKVAVNTPTPSIPPEAFVAPGGPFTYREANGNEIYHIDINTGQHTLVHSISLGNISDLNMSPDKKSLAYVSMCPEGGCPTNLNILEIESEKLTTIQLEPFYQEEMMKTLSYRWKNNVTIVYSFNYKSYSYNIPTKKPTVIAYIDPLDGYVAPDGTYLITPLKQNLAVKNLLTDKTTSTSAILSGNSSIIFSPDSNYFFIIPEGKTNATLFDKSVKKLLDIPTATMSELVPGVTGVDVFFSADSKSLFVIANSADTTSSTSGNLRRVGMVSDLTGDNLKEIAVDFIK